MALLKSGDTIELILKYTLIIGLGAVIFFLNEYHVLDPITTTWLIFILALIKNIFFILQSLRKIFHVVNKNVAYFRFLMFMTFNVLTIIFSFSVDYFCLYHIDDSHFTGVPTGLNPAELIFEFFYLSMLGFNNLGFYDVIPISLPAKLLVMGEIMLYYFSIILILSDFVSLRDSILEERLQKETNTHGSSLQKK